MFQLPERSVHVYPWHGSWRWSMPWWRSCRPCTRTCRRSSIGRNRSKLDGTISPESNFRWQRRALQLWLSSFRDRPSVVREEILAFSPPVVKQAMISLQGMACRDKICVYDEHPLARLNTILSNQELVEYRATKSWLEYTTTQKVRAGWNIQQMTKLGKVNYVILNQNDSCNCVTCKNNPGFQWSL